MTLKEIAKLAEDMVRTYNPEHIAPFPFENVANAFTDLDVYFTDLDDYDTSGVILFKDDRYAIIINTSKPETRQHFTLAHELGHYFLHKDLLHKEESIIEGDDWLDGPNILYRMNGAEDMQLELEANNFAGSLLMPEALVRRAWKVTGSIQECAALFHVSAVAMSVRLTRLGLLK